LFNFLTGGLPEKMDSAAQSGVMEDSVAQHVAEEHALAAQKAADELCFDIRVQAHERREQEARCKRDKRSRQRALRMSLRNVRQKLHVMRQDYVKHGRIVGNVLVTAGAYGARLHQPHAHDFCRMQTPEVLNASDHVVSEQRYNGRKIALDAFDMS
jgi:hypothetical protein